MGHVRYDNSHHQSGDWRIGFQGIPWGNFAHGKHELRPGSSAKSRQSNGRSKGKVHSAQERVGAMREWSEWSQKRTMNQDQS